MGFLMARVGNLAVEAGPLEDTRAKSTASSYSLASRHDEAVRDWQRRLDSAQEDPCMTWSTMKPRAPIEMTNAAWEDSPYGCKCRHRMGVAGVVNNSLLEEDVGEISQDIHRRV